MSDKPQKLSGPKDLEEWVRHYFETQHLMGRIMAGGMLLPALVVLAFLFFVFYFFFWLFSDDLPRYALLILSFLGLAGLFYAHRQWEKILSKENDEEPAARPEWQLYALHYGPLILFCGPRLLLKAWRTYLKIETYGTSIDFKGCAAVLAELLANERRIEIIKLQERLPGLDLEALLPQLRQIEGIQFITNLNPPGVLLTPSLRAELQKLILSS
jgi:hypothetical protein